MERTIKYICHKCGKDAMVTMIHKRQRFNYCGPCYKKASEEQRNAPR